MTDGNDLSDFPSPDFTVRLFCDTCGHQADLERDKVPEGMTVQRLRQHLRCTQCGGWECWIRVSYFDEGSTPSEPITRLRASDNR